MRKLNKTVSKILFSGILLSLVLLVGSCENWMSNDNFMEKIESEVHDANASQVNVYVRYANARWGTTEPQGNTTMKVDVASKISAVTSDEFGFVKWAAFSTKDFPVNKQHSNLMFISEKNYEANYKGKELPESVIRFADPKNPNTTVTIYSTNNDLFIVPIVTRRPEFESSYPVENDKAVKNTSIEIYFTKAIDEESLIDEEGNLNFNITSRSFMRQNDEEEDEDEDVDDESSSGDDITDYFNYTLKRSGKCLKLTLKEGKILDNNQNITVTLHEGLRDKYGFEMNGNAKFAFKTGTKSDSLSPIIQVLLGGNGSVRLGDFNAYHSDDELEGSATEASANAPRDIESDEYTPALVAQRVYDKLYLYVQSVDIIGADSNLTLDDKNLQEDNVGYIGISASLYIENTDDNNIPVTKDSDKLDRNIAKTNNVYIPGTIDSKADTSGLFTEIFRDVVPLDKDNPTSGYIGGEIFSYDVSKLPDGLIKIDVWAVDITGNSGDDLKKGAVFYNIYDNAYKSIFVVKDTTPIDSDNVKTKKQVISNSTEAPYYWYNKETLNSMELFDSPENKIQDAGHPKLRSLDKNLWWTFKVGNVKETVKKDDSSWRRIHDEETGETSIAYPLSDAQAPSKDGPVDITLYLKDDIGNLSEPVLLDSIMYDETKPTITLKKGKGDFIDAKGEPVQNNSKSNALGQILKVDFTEDNAESNVDAVSGIRQLEINIEKDGVKVPAPRTDAFKVLYVPSTVANPTPETTAAEGLREIPIATNDSYNSNNLVVFDVDDSTKITSGTFFIYGLTLGDTDGPWEISVNLYDSALNPAEKVATTIMKRDTTAPEIDKIYVNDAIKREVYNDTSKDSWWMPSSRLNSDGFYTVTFDIYVNETGSGLKYIKLPENVDINFTENTKLSANGLILSDYSFDEETNTITMLDEFEPKFINKETDGDKIHFALEDVQLKVNDSAAGNRAGIEVEDFVDNPKDSKNLTYSDNSNGTLIFTDTKAPQITDLRIEDSAMNEGNNKDHIGYKNQYTDENDNSSKYTDEQTVTLLLTLEPETVSGSGVKTVHLSEDAEFTTETEIEVDGTPLAPSEWEFSYKAITFKKVFIDANKLKFTNVKLESTTNGEQFIYAYLTDFAGLNTEVSKKSVGIIYDDVQPVIKAIDWDAPQFVAKGSANGNTVEDQKLVVDFEEVTSGVKVIKFDINYKPNNGDEETNSFATPFELGNFTLYYGNEPLNKGTDYTINGKYIILNTPVITKNGEKGTFKFDKITLRDSRAEGNYNIYVTLLDAAENINPQKETAGATYKRDIVIDTTDPVVEKVQVLGAKKREVYGNPSDTHNWWMPTSSSLVNLEVTINEAGASIQKIKIDEDVEFTSETKLYLKNSKKYLTENEDYLLDTEENIITLLDKFFVEKLLSNDNENQFVLENVKLKKANTLDGNTVKLGLKDFVRNEGDNQNKIYFDNKGTLEEGTLVYLDSIKPEVAGLTIEDSDQNDVNNPLNKGNDVSSKYKYTDDNHVKLTLKLKSENDKEGSGVKKVTLSENAEFTGQTQIKVDGTLLNTSEYEWTNNKTVEFHKVFTAENTLEFTNVEISTNQGNQLVKAYLTDFVTLDSEVAPSNTVIYDNVAPVINEIKWTSDDPAESLTNSEKELIDNKTLNVKFTEETAGVKLIKFDIVHGEKKYATPFAGTGFKLFYNTNELNNNTDYDIDGQYIILKKSEDYKSGLFSFNNLKLNGSDDEGLYTINVSLLDASENINVQTGNSINLSIDTTDPVIERVDVLDAIGRTDYSDSTNTTTWWMPADKFESADSLSKVDLKLTINEIGSGIRYIKLDEDAEFTDNTELTRVDSNVTLVENTDYKLVDNHTIELLDHDIPKLNGTAANPNIVIKLTNVKLNKINAVEGNKVKAEVEDFVYHTNTNAVTDGYKIYYDEKDYSGFLVYADYTKPVISELKIVDSEQAANVNPDAKGFDSENYTDNENVVLYLTIKAETLSHGSGVNKITLVNNSAFTGNTEIFADNTKLESGYTISDNKHTVTFNKVFTAETVIKFTNVKFVNASNDNLNQTITAKLTDFVGLTSDVKSDAIVFDITPADITKLEWGAPEGVAKGSANTNEVTDQTFKVTFTEAAAGVKVIKFDVTYDGDAVDSPSYVSPFSMSNFKLYYNDVELTNDTDYTIEDGRYIVLNTPKLTGSFNFENLKLRNASAEGEYNIKVTLLDAAENRNWNENTATSKYNKKIFIDTTAPVVEKVLVDDAQNREVYNDVSNAKKWWMPSSKFDGEGELSKVSLQITVNEAGSGLKIIKLSENVAFTADSKLKKGTDELTKGTNYVLDTTENTITLLDYENPILRGSANAPAVVFTLENVKLNNINDAAGNKVAVTVEDFVTNPGSNRIDTSDDFKIYYPDESDGTLIFADSENPEILDLDIEDASHNAVTNPDNKAWDKDNYTDSQNVTLILTLAAEDTDAGSGVKVITLTDNAEFTTTGTDAEISKIFVDGTELTTGYDFALNKKSVTFEQVFIAANEIKFTNVKLPATEGTYSVKANLKDFAGWNATADSTSNPIMLDTSAPAISEIKWMPDDTTVTAGTTNTAVVANQSLNVAFTEAVSGVKVIKLDITSEKNNSSYATPFAASNFTLKCGNTELTDYTIDGKYIILNHSEKTNNFNFHGIKIANTADECVYTIKVTLLDAAENNVIDTKTISIDVTNPEIDGNLRIHDLIRSVELTTDSTVTEKYWLPKAYINASVTTGQAPASIPVYLTIKERTSGIKIFEFSEDVVLNKENTKLYKIDSNAADETSSDARTLIPVTGYDIDNDAHTITIRNEVFAKENFAKKNDSNEEEPFIILVDNIGFAHADSSSEVSENSITIKLSDVAKNVSNTATTAQANIYSDSIAPAEPQNLILVDRKNTSDEIAASTGYTNESIVDMKFNLLASEQFGSGYHKFVISGATFKSTDDVTYVTDATTVTMTVGSGSSAQVIQNLSFEISDEGHTLTLKKSRATADAMAVIRKAVNVEIKNIHLDNPDVEDEGASDKHTVTLKAYDLAGWDSSASTANIKLDKSAPELAEDSNGKKGPFVANYTKTYYKPSINVYPHVSSGIETVHGVDVDYSGTSYPTFYTATSYADSGVSAENGEVKLANGVSYGAVLGIRAKDNVMLGGYNRSKTFLYYIADSNFSKTKAQILASGTNLAADINNNCAVGTTNDNYKSTALWFGFTSGKYSAVIVDEAGNVSDVFRFAVVTDTAKPAKEWNSGNDSLNDSPNDSLNARVLLQMPDASANVFTNNAVAEVDSGKLPRYKAEWINGNFNIRTKGYVTKKTDKKYKLVLNLGENYSTSTPITNIDGSEATQKAKYGELDSTPNSSPIEMYAVSTYYSSWPTSVTSPYKYAPVVPYGTTFPSGEAHTENDSTKAKYFASYFGYNTSSVPESSYWRIPNKNVNWHAYKTGINYEDTGNGIESYIDENNNLIIEIPNTQSTAPISVFLRDGCGNMQYVVCGLFIDDEKEVAVSFVIDDKLGAAETVNGKVTTPFILQFPYSTVRTSGNVATGDVPWGVDSSDEILNFILGAQSGNSEAPTTQYGTGEKLGFIKDHVKHATYYNPNLSDTEKAKQFKHGFALHFWGKGGSSSSITAREDITFADFINDDQDEQIKQKKIIQASAQDIEDGNYTCRALLYCTNTTDVPTYDEIITCLNNERDAADDEKTGQVTEWSYVKVSPEATEAILFVDYPQPNLKELGWTTNDSNHEPVPYYMWYIFEDRVGNYELAKVVNSAVAAEDLAKAPSATSSDFDKWLFDGEKPKLTIRNTTTEPNQVGKTQEEVSKLVATNNGYVPYLDGTTIWVSSDYDREGRDPSLLNENVGWGTTHEVEYNSNSSSNKTNRRYMPFADLVVDEITGIRAFCWTNYATPPSYTYVAYDGNTQGDSSLNKWYAGYNVTSCYKDIGDSWIYGGNSTNAYFRTGNYASTYSGTKVNTILPPSKLSSSTASVLYLHVMDWTGNIESYRMGSLASGLKFSNDTSEPEWKGASSENVKYEPNKYYVHNQLAVRIAGKETAASSKETMEIHFPSDYFADKSGGAGLAGFILKTGETSEDNKLSVFGVKEDAEGIYLEIPYTTYKNWGSNGKLVDFFGFDKVGNYKDFQLTGYFDETAPAFDKVSFVTESTATKFIHESTTSTPIDALTTYDYTPKNATNNVGNSEVQEIYVNNSKTSKFKVKITSATSTDFRNVALNYWDGSKWQNLSNCNTETANTGKWNATEEWTISSDNITYEMSAYNLLDFAAEGTTYQIVLTDLAGNNSYQYFKLYLDKQGPELAVRTDAEDESTSTTPTIELGKGSINYVETDSNKTYYYTAYYKPATETETEVDERLKIKFAMSDAGIKNSAQKFYYSFDNKATWEEITTPTDVSTDVTAKISAGDIEYLYLKDVLGNITKYIPGTTDTTDTTNTKGFEGYNYTYKNASEEDENITITKLTKYTGSTPAAPTYTTHNWNNTNYTESIETYGKNWHTPSPGYSDWYAYQLAGRTDTIIITNKEREKLKITFTKPNNIIGYLKIDDTSSEPDKTPGIYSFKELDTYFEEDLPHTYGSDFSERTRKYYAVDVVGNISEALTLTYSYDNPHAAQNAMFIADPLNSSEIAEDVRKEMKDDNLDIVITSDDGTTRIFNGGFMVIRCTLKEKAGANYSDTPNKITLYSGNSNTKVGESGSSADVFKVYYSKNTEKDDKDEDGRYYCYIAFKPGTYDYFNTFKPGVLDNISNGANLYCEISGQSSTSEKMNITPNSSISWKIDTQAPTISSNYYKDSDNVHKLYNYKIYDSAGNEVSSIPKAKDNNIEENAETNLYTSKSVIYYQVRRNSVAQISDNLTDWKKMKYKFVVTEPQSYTAKASYTDTDWKDMTVSSAPGNNSYKYELPDVTSPHRFVALFLMDNVGNITEPYYLGDKTNEKSVWWLLDNRLTEGGATTVTASTSWSSNANKHKFDVTPPVGSIINSVSVKVNGVEATNPTVKFNGYKSNATINGSNNWVNVSGLTVEINQQIRQSWKPKNVEITLNGANGVTATAENYVPAFTLTKDYIETQAAVWELNKRSDYEVFVTVKNGQNGQNGPTADNINDITANNADVDSYEVVTGTNNKKIKVILKNVVAQDWGNDQTVTLRINNSFNTDAVLTVPKIAPEHIGINELTWDSGTDVADQDGYKEFNVNVTIPDGASDITGISASNCTLVSSNITSSPAIAKIRANKGWTTKTPKLVITGSYNDGQSTKEATVSKNVLNIAPLAKSDLSLSLNPSSYVEGTTEYELTVNVPANVAIPDNSENKTYISANYATITKFSGTSVNKYKLTVSPDYGEKVVSVTVQDFEPFGNVLTVTPKALEEGDITISDAVWNTEKSQYESSISFRTVQSGTGPSMANVTGIVLDSETSGNAEIEISGTTITYKNLKKRSWDDQYVNLIVNNNSALKFEKVLKISALTAEDIDVKLNGSAPAYTVGTNEYVLDISVTDDATLTNADFELTTQDGTKLSTTIATGSYNADNKKYTLNVTPAWVDTDVYLKIKSFEPRTLFTVTQKSDEAKANDIKLTFEEGVTGWSASKTSYTVNINDVPVDITSVVKAEGSAPVSVEWNGEKTATLTEIKQGWEDKDVILSINGIAKKIFTVGKLGRNAITIKQGENAPTYDAETTVYVLDISVTDNAELKTTDFTVTNSDGSTPNPVATGTFNAGTNKYTLTVTPIWENKSVYLKIKGFDPFEIFEVTKRTLTDDDFELGTATEVTGEGITEKTYEIPVTFKNNAPASEITKVTADNSVKVKYTAINATPTDESQATGKITLTKIPTATWSEQNISLTINPDSNGGIAKSNVLKIAAKTLTSDDFELETATEVTGEGITELTYEIPVTFKNNAPASALKNVTADNNVEVVFTALNETPTAESQATGKITLTKIPAQTWSKQEIELTINENSELKFKGLEIPAKVPGASDISVTTSDNKTLTPATGDNAAYIQYEFILKVTEGLKITSVKYSDTNISSYPNWQDGKNLGDIYQLSANGTAFTENEVITIGLKVSGTEGDGIEVSKYLFKDGGPTQPDGDGNTQAGEGSGGNDNGAGGENQGKGTEAGALNKTTRSILGSRAQAASYTTSSTAASTEVESPKSRSISLISWVSDIFNSDSEVAGETVKDEVITTSRKAAKKAKKAEKKSVKKAAQTVPVLEQTLPVSEIVVETAVEAENLVSDVKEAAAAVVTKDAQMTATAGNIVEAEPSVIPEVLEVSIDEPAVTDAKAIIWTLIAALSAALITAITVIYRKRHQA